MKSIRLTKHALEQCVERGTDKTEISEAISLRKCYDENQLRSRS